MNKIYVNVALPIKINSTFLYSLPEGLTLNEVLYRSVEVVFNKRVLRGFCVSEGKYTDNFTINSINKILNSQPVLKKSMIDFAEWMANYYFAGIGEVLTLMVPKVLKPAIEKPIDNFIPLINQLTEEQEKIFRQIQTDIANGLDKFYLYGITGSGKTEIYIKLIEDVINQGKEVIFLVPEIALSYQTLERLKKRFGTLCAVLHSNLKGSEKLKEFIRLYEGRAKIAVGPRSALFAPLSNLGLIIIDEENESAYKSEESPRFHSRTAAQFLADYHNATLVLGSATPAIESWYFASNRYLKLYQLKERYGGAILPEIHIIDCTKFTVKKNLSLPLTDEINLRLQKKEQIVLLQNRRGFANFVKCSKCGHIFECPKCNLSYTYHKTKNKMICHHCGHTEIFPEICPECKEIRMLKIGAGTQRIEDEISMIFNHARVQRMDQDLLRSSFDYNMLFKQIEAGEIDILVGTQMIAKGLHFPRIKFVGIVDADLILNVPDFKAAERTFALITQVAGRAGREGEKGFVMIQTRNPEHYSINCAKNNDYEGFYQKEIDFRKIMGMPPFYRLIRLVIRGKNEEKINEDIMNLAGKLKALNLNNVQILGPAPCLFTKLNNNFRYQILLKDKKISTIQNLLKKVLEGYKPTHKNHLEIDVDPVGLF